MSEKEAPVAGASFVRQMIILYEITGNSAFTVG